MGQFGDTPATQPCLSERSLRQHPAMKTLNMMSLNFLAFCLYWKVYSAETQSRGVTQHNGPQLYVNRVVVMVMICVLDRWSNQTTQKHSLHNGN